MPPLGAKIVPSPSPAGSPEEEAKKETAVLGRPVEAPRPKKDTSRVQVVAARPAAPDAQRPAVKLRHDEPAPTFATATAPSSVRTTVAVSSGGDVGLSVVAMVLSIGVAGYLAWLVFG
jgi:hypothetical protein